MEQPDHIRIGNDDRDAARRRLAVARDEGRLTEPEYRARLSALESVATYGDLRALTEDLPGDLGPGFSREDPLMLVPALADVVRRKRWACPPYLSVETGIANVKLDFQLAELSGGDRVDIELVGGLGNLVIIVPQGWGVDTRRVGKGLGSVKTKVPIQAAWGQPCIVVHGSVGFGGLKVRHPSWLDRRLAGTLR